MDTSIYGGYFDLEFKASTEKLIDFINSNDVTIVNSFITDLELLKAPQQVKDLHRAILINSTELVDFSDEIHQLAEAYIDHGIVRKSSYADCLHVAAATIGMTDLLISWDFRHILRSDSMEGYLRVNRLLGYSTPIICTPTEAISNEH